MRRRGTLLAWLAAGLLSAGSPALAGGSSPGLEAYVQGRLDEAVVALKHELREQAKNAPNEPHGATDYFLGRGFRELGLRGLALHYLGQAERYGGEAWTRLARRELARAYFEIGDYPTVLRLLDRTPPAEQEGEVLYYAGLSAAIAKRFADGEGFLSRVRDGDPFHGYALYARAQTRAALENFDGALADLDQVIALEHKASGARAEGISGWFGADAVPPSDLADQARILRGNILYLVDRGGDARESFRAVRRGGAPGFAAMRGLLLTGARKEAAATPIEPSASRPVDSTTLLLVRAVVAEESGDAATAKRLRDEIASLADRRLQGLERLRAEAPAETALGGDLAGFWIDLRAARMRDRWWTERQALPEKMAGGLDEPTAPAPFEPRDGAFYGVWERSRTDAWLRSLIELRARFELLARDLAVAPEKKPFWAFWRSEDDLRFAYAMLTIRLCNLRMLVADQLYTTERATDQQLHDRKDEAAREAADILDELYVGKDVKAPPLVTNLKITADYKRADVFRLVEAVPERATDPAISLFGNYIDLLQELRTALEKARVKVPPLGNRGAELRERLQAANERSATEVSLELRKAMEPSLRVEQVFFTRVVADNQGSLSRLFARLGAGPTAGPTPDEAAPEGSGEPDSSEHAVPKDEEGSD